MSFTKEKIIEILLGKDPEEQAKFDAEYKKNQEFRQKVDEICEQEDVQELLDQQFEEISEMLFPSYPTEEDILKFGPTQEQKDAIWRRLQEKLNAKLNAKQNNIIILQLIDHGEIIHQKEISCSAAGDEECEDVKKIGVPKEIKLTEFAEFFDGEEVVCYFTPDSTKNSGYFISLQGLDNVKYLIVIHYEDGTSVSVSGRDLATAGRYYISEKKSGIKIIEIKKE